MEFFNKKQDVIDVIAKQSKISGEHIKNRYEEISGGMVNQGSIVVFPSYKYHCVTPVNKGTRYSLVVWFNGRPMK